jgi:hypothetical protein
MRRQKTSVDTRKLRSFDNSSKHLNNERLEKEMRDKLDKLSLKDHRIQTQRDYEIMQAKSDIALQQTARRLILDQRRKSTGSRPPTAGSYTAKPVVSFENDAELSDELTWTARDGTVTNTDRSEKSEFYDSPASKARSVTSAVRPHTTGLPGGSFNAAAVASPKDQRQVKSAAAVVEHGGKGASATPLPLSGGGEQARKRVCYILRARMSAPARSRRQIRAQLQAELDARRKKQISEASSEVRDNILDLEATVVGRWTKTTSTGGRPAVASRRPITLEAMLTMVVGREERSMGELKRVGHIDVMVEVERARRRERVMEIRRKAELAKKQRLTERMASFYQALRDMKDRDTSYEDILLAADNAVAAAQA